MKFEPADRNPIVYAREVQGVDYSRIPSSVHNLIMCLPLRSRIEATVAYLNHGVVPEKPFCSSSYDL